MKVKQMELDSSTEADVVQELDPIEQMPFGPDGARFLCNLLQHGVFLGGVMLLLMIIGYFGPPQ